MDKDNYSHKLYKHVEDQKKADALAWSFVNKDKMILFPYQFPVLEDDEVRLKITYSGLCWSDVSNCRGHWGPKTYPLAPGHEVVGVVTQLGNKVTKFKLGDKVCLGPQRRSCTKCKVCLSGHENYCRCLDPDQKLTYNLWWGGYSTHMQQPESFLFHLPEGIPENVAPPLLCAGVTVWSPIVKYITKGMTTAVLGIGGLGHLAVQYLAKLGYDVTAITSSLDKVEYIKSLGATRVINFNSKEDLKTWENKFDVILNCTSVSGDLDKLVDLASPLGRIIQVGVPDITDKLKVGNGLVGKGIKLTGSIIGSPKEIQEMLDFSDKNKIYPLCEEFDFSEFPKAFDHLEHGKPKFRCVVNIKDYSEKNGYFK